MSLPLDAQIEALLFWKGEPMKIEKIAEMLGADASVIEDAISTLEEKLKEKKEKEDGEGKASESRGIVLVRKDDEVTLGTTPEMSELLEKFTKEELSKDLGKAGLETLTIILYKGPITKSEVDYVRGVNSGHIIRNLLVRGFVERINNPERTSGFLYRPSFDLLQHLGVSKIEDLPEHDTFRGQIEEVLKEEEK